MDGLAASAYCLKCDYPLGRVAGVAGATGGTGGTCPECGRGFDLADGRTFAAKPGARRRRWIRRGWWALGAVVLVELLAPGRVARLTWSWPNADGVTATTVTKWCLVGPRWLPVRYPRWTSSQRSKPIESGGLVVLDAAYRRVGYWSIYRDGGAAMSLGSGPPGTAARTVGWLGGPDGVGVSVQPGNIDRLCDMLLGMDGVTPLIFSSSIQPATRGGTTTPSGESDQPR